MRLNDIQIKKNRTDGTAYMILDLIKGLDLTAMMSDIFMYTEDPIAKELIKRYELQLVGAFEDPKGFQKNLHTFFRETASYIKKQQLYKEFFSFSYFVCSNLSVKGLKREKDPSYRASLNCYYNILFQQMNYFVPHPKIAYGLDTKGKLMLRDEPFPNLDVILMNAYHNDKKSITKENLYKSFRKIGYDIHSERDFNIYHSNDQLITNMTLVMSYFINENTVQINPSDYYLVANGMNLPKQKVTSDNYKKILQEKRYFLPKGGLIGRYKHCEEIKEIFFQEVFTENRIVLLYKVIAVNGKELCGFYDNKLELFYSPWESTDFGQGIHKSMENFILESYCYLTTEIEVEMKEMELEKRLYLQHEVPIITMNPIPSVQFLYEDKEENPKKQKKAEKSFRIFDKKSYKEGKITIHPFVRKLPTGESASEEAIALAKSYHFVLREGETFVRPFEKTSYRKE